MTPPTHPLFPPPPHPQMRIWRYLDFTKLVSLLHRRALYFSRADLLGDRFEGSYPKANSAMREAFRQELLKNVGADAQGILRTFTDIHKSIRAWTFLNCWHTAEYESVAMWKVYTQTNEAVAVQSTYQHLRDTLPDSILIGRVRYIDFEKDVIPESNMLYPFLYKRLSFSYENELRALILHVPLKDGAVTLDSSKQPKGKYIPVELNTLIERVYVAPGAPGWFLELVRDVTQRYELSKDVHQSSLDTDPFF